MIVRSTMYMDNVHCTHCTVYTVYNVHYPCILYIVHCTITIYTVHCKLYKCTMYIVQITTLYNVHCTMYNHNVQSLTTPILSNRSSILIYDEITLSWERLRKIEGFKLTFEVASRRGESRRSSNYKGWTKWNHENRLSEYCWDGGVKEERVWWSC